MGWKGRNVRDKKHKSEGVKTKKGGMRKMTNSTITASSTAPMHIYREAQREQERVCETEQHTLS